MLLLVFASELISLFRGHNFQFELDDDIEKLWNNLKFHHYSTDDHITFIRGVGNYIDTCAIQNSILNNSNSNSNQFMKCRVLTMKNNNFYCGK